MLEWSHYCLKFAKYSNSHYFCLIPSFDVLLFSNTFQLRFGLSEGIRRGGVGLVISIQSYLNFHLNCGQSYEHSMIIIYDSMSYFYKNANT